jgi:hypothetical protein
VREAEEEVGEVGEETEVAMSQVEVEMVAAGEGRCGLGTQFLFEVVQGVVAQEAAEEGEEALRRIFHAQTVIQDRNYLMYNGGMWELGQRKAGA